MAAERDPMGDAQDPRRARILVTGATGFIGRNLVPVLRRRYPRATVLTASRSDFDLTRQDEAEAMFDALAPDLVFHLAGFVGGILANATRPADFYWRNLTMVAFGIHYAWRHGVKKILVPIGGCAYPARAPSPIEESSMWEGLPQFESAPYSVAKKVALVQCEAYRRQHGFKGIVVIPGNIYGPHDNFDLEGGHVIPALIRRFHEARRDGAESVTVWGSGRPVRDFVYVGDVAALLPEFMERYDAAAPINLTTGRGTRIRDLVEMIKTLTGYTGRVVWDEGKPDGQREKTFSAARLAALGHACPTPLDEGLKRTIAWYRAGRGRDEAEPEGGNRE